MFGRMIKSVGYVILGIFITYFLYLVKTYMLSSTSSTFQAIYAIVHVLLAIFLIFILPTTVFLQDVDHNAS